jgi:hypothetical protein
MEEELKVGAVEGLWEEIMLQQNWELSSGLYAQPVQYTRYRCPFSIWRKDVSRVDRMHLAGILTRRI